jgi:hypothetical protein
MSDSILIFDLYHQKVLVVFFWQWNLLVGHDIALKHQSLLLVRILLFLIYTFEEMRGVLERCHSVKSLSSLEGIKVEGFNLYLFLFKLLDYLAEVVEMKGLRRNR